MDSFTDTYANWDLVACTPTCRRPWRRWRWRAPRIWACPGCRTRWTVEGRRWAQAMSPAQLARMERELNLTEVVGVAEQQSLREAVTECLRSSNWPSLTRDPGLIVNPLLIVIADRMRDEIGGGGCGCGGCDSCAQHALVDWLDPR